MRTSPSLNPRSIVTQVSYVDKWSVSSERPIYKETMMHQLVIFQRYQTIYDQITNVGRRF
ncbi:hypothetical protein LINPERHAP2_LOCUS42151 [Linum perenne]